MGGVGPIRDDLEPIADPELHATLDRIVAHRDTTARDPEATMTYGVVSAATAGSTVPHPPPACPGGPGSDLRGPRLRAESRGRAEGAPTRTRRRPGQPRPLPARGRDHRPARAPRRRPGLRPGLRRPGPPLLRHAVGQGRDPQGGDRALPRGRDRRRRRPAAVEPGAAAAPEPVRGRLQRRWPTPTAGA